MQYFRCELAPTLSSRTWPREVKTVQINFTKDKNEQNIFHFMKPLLKIIEDILQRNYDVSLAYRSQLFACIGKSLDQRRFCDSLRLFMYPRVFEVPIWLVYLIECLRQIYFDAIFTMFTVFLQF